MLEHVTLLVRNYAKAKAFYTAALRPLGYKLTMDFPKYKAAGFKEGGHTSFWIAQKKRFAPTHVAFLAKSKKMVGDFHAAALKAGGKDHGGRSACVT